MSILHKLSRASLRLNKKRTIGTLIGIILSVALVTAVAGMGESLRSTLLEATISRGGYYHYALPKIDEETLETVEANHQVKKVMTTYEMGAAILPTGTEEARSYLYIRSTDYFDELAYILESGRKPERAGEIVIPSILANERGYKIGDVLELDVGVRMSNDGYVLSEHNGFDSDIGEKILDPVHKTYEIVGTYQGTVIRTYAYGSIGMKNSVAITTGEKSKTVSAYVALRDPQKRDIFLASLYATGKFDTPTNQSPDNYTIQTNHELLRWEVFAFSDDTINMLVTVIAVVLLIIVIASVYCIKNSFDIANTEKSRILGMLASVGATKKQIKKMTLIEAFTLGIIGIPLGIASGVLATFILVHLVNYITAGTGLLFMNGLVFNISALSILIATSLGIITIYSSAIVAAHRASKASPIENIKSSKDIVLSAKSMHTPKVIGKIFKTGGVLAYKNLRRSKKKYRTTVISLTVSIFIFIALNSFLTDTFREAGGYYYDYDYNVSISSIANATDEDIDYIRSLDGVKKMYTLYEIRPQDSDASLRIYDRGKYNNHDGGALCDEYEAGIGNCIGREYFGLYVIGLDDETFKDYTQKIKVDYDYAKNKGILADEVEIVQNGRSKQARRYKYNKGETIKGTFMNSEFSIEVAGIAKENPYGMEHYSYDGGFLILNKKYFKNINFTPFRITIEADDTYKVTSKIEKYKSEFSVTDLNAEVKSQRAMILVISIFLYGFITVITLIGVTNIFNTITSNMDLRQKEFAMLKSIGMTKKEFNRMINLETLFYSTKALIYGIVLGLVGAYGIHYGFNLNNETEFLVPWGAILISIVFVFIIVSIIMHFSIAKINKQNTIETIRKENV